MNMPPWVYDLINALERHEREHDQHDGCLFNALLRVPFNEREKAAAIADYLRERTGSDDQSVVA